MELIEKYRKIIDTLESLKYDDEPEEFILPNEDLLSAEFEMIAYIYGEIGKIDFSEIKTKEEARNRAHKIIGKHYWLFEKIYGEENALGCPHPLVEMVERLYENHKAEQKR